MGGVEDVVVKRDLDHTFTGGKDKVLLDLYKKNSSSRVDQVGMEALVVS